VLIEDGEITDPTSGTGITFGHGTVRRVEIHHMGADAINVHAGAIVENCYIHHLGMTDGSHADGISGSSPDGKPVLGVIIRNNFIDMPHWSSDRGSTAHRANWTIGLGLFGTDAQPTIVENNWLNGGNRTVNSGANGYTNIIYRNNFFGRDYGSGLRQTHSNVTPQPYFTDDHWQNNRWMDTGAVIPPEAG
jgi:hypothetical protein